MSSIAINPELAAGREPPSRQRQNASSQADTSHALQRRGDGAMRGLARHGGALGAVVALHLAVLWAFNAGLHMRPATVVVPVQVMAELVEEPRPLAQAPVPLPPQPKVAPVAKPPPPKPIVKPAPQPTPALPPAPATTPMPLPVAVDPTPFPLAAAATSVQTPQPTAPTTPTAVAPAPPPAAVAPPARAPVVVELPSSDAQYLQNPKPRYPAMSRRLGEQGTVLIQVMVTEKGLAQDARIKTSSGFFRLDNAALEAVSQWRFVPGKRGGVPESMLFTVPITFGLQ